MVLNYNEYLETLKNIDNPQSMQWSGNLFLSPCNCSSPLHKSSTGQPVHCTAVSSATKFDFKSTNDIDCNTLINLCDYIDPASTSRSTISYWLCNKYSLCNVPSPTLEHLHNLASTNEKQFLKTEEFKNCSELLKSDLNVLSPFNRCKLTFIKSKVTKHNIKYIVQCSQSHKHQVYKDRKGYKPTLKPRKCDTSKPTSNDLKCGFNINLFFDFKSLRWFMKLANNITHTHHHPTNISDFQYGQKHIPQFMQKELKKLNKVNKYKS